MKQPGCSCATPLRSSHFVRSESAAVQTSRESLCRARLCRSALRKGSAFPNPRSKFSFSAPSAMQTAQKRLVGDSRTERRSLSAKQAAKPQAMGQRPERNLDKPWSETAATIVERPAPARFKNHNGVCPWRAGITHAHNPSRFRCPNTGSNSSAPGASGKAHCGSEAPRWAPYWLSPQTAR